MNDKRFRIGKVFISITSPEDTISQIEKAVKAKKNEYICISNVRTVRYANQNSDYCELMNNAYMCTPDGMPLVWMAKLWGIKNAQRSNGPKLFKSMIGNHKSGIKHFLLGDTDDTLEKIRNAYPEANIVGTYSPPFCPIEEYNLQYIADLINESNADIVWISMRAPKQDYLSKKLMDYLENKICIGVGAAFRFALGQYNEPSIILQKMGLTGFFFRKLKFKDCMMYLKYCVSVSYWGGAILLARLRNLLKI